MLRLKLNHVSKRGHWCHEATMRFGNALFWKKIFIYNLNQNLSDRPIFFNLHSILDQVWCLCFGFEISVRFLNHVCVERCQWYQKFYKLMGNITIIICSKYTYHHFMGCLHTMENEIPTFPCLWCLVEACYFFLRFCMSIAFLDNLCFSWYLCHHNRISSQPYNCCQRNGNSSLQFLVASLMSLTASLMTTCRMQQCFNVMCISCNYEVFSVPVLFLYTVWNKTNYCNSYQLFWASVLEWTFWSQDPIFTANSILWSKFWYKLSRLNRWVSARKM